MLGYIQVKLEEFFSEKVIKREVYK